MRYSVGYVAGPAGVRIRTLHHYDTWSGCYHQVDVVRLVTATTRCPTWSGSNGSCSTESSASP